MSTGALVLGWWVGVVLPVVIVLSLLSLVALPWISRASWRFQSNALLVLLATFGLLIVAPFIRGPEATDGQASVTATTVSAPSVSTEVEKTGRGTETRGLFLALIGVV